MGGALYKNFPLPNNNLDGPTIESSLVDNCPIANGERSSVDGRSKQHNSHIVDTTTRFITILYQSSASSFSSSSGSLSHHRLLHLNPLHCLLQHVRPRLLLLHSHSCHRFCIHNHQGWWEVRLVEAHPRWNCHSSYLNVSQSINGSTLHAPTCRIIRKE